MSCLNFRRKYVNILHPEAISAHLNETASLLLPLYYFWSNKVKTASADALSVQISPPTPKVLARLCKMQI